MESGRSARGKTLSSGNEEMFGVHEKGEDDIAFGQLAGVFQLNADPKIWHLYLLQTHDLMSEPRWFERLADA